MDNFEKTLEEMKYCHDFVQMVRGILFWMVEPDENRDRLALVILARAGKEWAEASPARLEGDIQQFYLEHCQKILDAGPKSDGPEMPAPWGVGISTH